MRPRPALLVLALALLAFLLRVFRLDAFSLRGDEAFTVLFVQQPWTEMWNGIRTIEPNPPLMYLLLRAWLAMAGAGEFAARFFSVFWGVLCVPLIYRAGRAMLSLPDPDAASEARPDSFAIRACLFAAFLMAINPYQIWHSQDVRNYTMWPALSLGGLVLYFAWLRLELSRGEGEQGNEGAGREQLLANHGSLWKGQRAQSGKWFAAWVLVPYTLVTLASLYTHYYDTFLLIAENLFVLAVLWRRWPALVRWFSAQAALAVLYLPWPLVFSDRASSYGEGSGLQGLTLFDIFHRTFASFVLGDTLPGWMQEWGWILFALAALLVWYRVLAPRRPRLAAWFLLYAAVPTLAVWALNLFRPLFLERYLNAIAPAYYLVLAVGVAALASFSLRLGRSLAVTGQEEGSDSSLGVTRHKAADAEQTGSGPVRLFPLSLLRGGQSGVLVLFLLLSAWSLGGYWFNPVYAKAPDWTGLIHLIARASQPGDVVLQNFPEMASFYYAQEVKGTPPIQVLPRDFLPDAKTDTQLDKLASQYERIWFIPAAPDFWDPDHAVESWLDAHAALYEEQSVSTFRVRLYATPKRFMADRTPTQVRVDTFATLVGYRLAPSAQGSDTLLTLYWQVASTPRQSYTAFAHALDANGRVIAQQDNPPANGTRPTNNWKPGEIIVDAYRLTGTGANVTIEVGMYDPQTVVRLPLYDASGARLPDDRLVIR